ncbi:MAG: T9SS C-terminal target domain-containing protein, partial [Verrucomicrobia bacterium]
MKKRLIQTVTMMCACVILALKGQSATIIANQQLTGTINWTRDNTYQLNGAVFVKSGAVLNIEAGTVIKGNNLGTFGTNIAALYVC